jgi:hypothetical protein
MTVRFVAIVLAIVLTSGAHASSGDDIVASSGASTTSATTGHHSKSSRREAKPLTTATTRPVQSPATQNAPVASSGADCSAEPGATQKKCPQKSATKPPMSRHLGKTAKKAAAVPPSPDYGFKIENLPALGIALVAGILLGRLGSILIARRPARSREEDREESENGHEDESDDNNEGKPVSNASQPNEAPPSPAEDATAAHAESKRVEAPSPPPAMVVATVDLRDHEDRLDFGRPMATVQPPPKQPVMPPQTLPSLPPLAEPVHQPAFERRIDHARVEDLVRTVGENLSCTPSEIRDLTDIVSERQSGPKIAEALFLSLSKFRNESRVTSRWAMVETDLIAIISLCFDDGGELIAPKRGAAFDLDTMNDYSSNITGGRSVVRKLLAPGFKAGASAVKASVETG